MYHLLVHLVFYHRFIELALFSFNKHDGFFVSRKEADIEKRRWSGIAFAKILIKQKQPGETLYFYLYNKYMQ
jgi:hypothetical protein